MPLDLINPTKFGQLSHNGFLLNRSTLTFFELAPVGVASLTVIFFSAFDEVKYLDQNNSGFVPLELLYWAGTEINENMS